MEPESVGIEFIMLTDRAEVLNGKLYMMGGGYDRRIINDIKTPVTLSFVVSVLVPWSLTNQPHTLRIKVETEDGATIGQEFQGQLTVGRSAQAISGQLFRVMSVVNITSVLPQLGGYRVIASLLNGETRTTAFYAVEATAAGSPP